MKDTGSALRLALVASCEGREKLIALESFPDVSEATARSELSKILRGERGESTLRVIDTARRFGHREPLVAHFSERALDPEELLRAAVRLEQHVEKQLDLFGGDVRTLTKQLKETAEALIARRA